MRPVNLLPGELRPRQRAREGGGGRAHIVLGVLGVLLVMAVAYALSLNQVNSHKTEVARAKSEIEKAKTEVAASTAFGNFHAIEQTRSASVQQLAGGRFDWERMMRELALVLPAHTWLLNANAATSAAGAAGGAAGGASTPAPPATGSPAAAAGDSASSGASSPTLDLKGCALKQNDVAVVLVRLRKLYLVDNVNLNESAQETTDKGVQTTSDSAGGSDTCGSGRFKFDVSVTFSAPTTKSDKPAGGGKVPAKLGGGS
jgi:Tfp pilus assembly protein PilN